MHRNLDESQMNTLRHLLLPLPSARLKIDVTDPRAEIIDEVLADEGFGLSEMKIRGMREPFFSKGEREALLMPAGLSFSIEADDLHPGETKLVLGFDLPRGCYATMIVKRVQAGCSSD